MKKLSERKILERDLLFYLRYYNKVTDRMQAQFDYEIQRIIEKLKQLPNSSR
jgi:hypothetical protein